MTLREMFAKEFVRENGNAVISLPEERIKELKKWDEIEFLFSFLADHECTVIGEQFCLNNYEMGCAVFDEFADKVYVFPFRFLEDMKEGKDVTLTGKEPTEEDREELKRW